MTSRTAPRPPAARGFLARHGWPIGIGAALLLSAGANIAIMLVARGDPAFAVEPDYYDKAVRWDEAMAQARANEALGWVSSATLTLGAAGGTGLVTVRLADRHGQSVSGAMVRLEAMHNARSADRRTVSLAEATPGRYQAALDAERPGEWELRVVAVRNGERFTTSLRVVAVTAGPPGA